MPNKFKCYVTTKESAVRYFFNKTVKGKDANPENGEPSAQIVSLNATADDGSGKVRWRSILNGETIEANLSFRKTAHLLGKVQP